ncbi:hypothetical protein IMZ11_08290 [Microtetraspora sp. AC03309]|uniref:hypothetical protein n=1 Tax=Microtetraspora sp. AC03309 TaxID=2779376 RepID=UPI001E4A7137|nr:hypothetical protein [Microtetraspora sp. AC03309]MCC5575640.1 hypothetical protein [Microtetraspora sp. AC03309]
MTLQSAGQWFHTAGPLRMTRSGVVRAAIAVLLGSVVALAAHRSLSAEVDDYLATHRQITATVLDDHEDRVTRGATRQVAWVDERGARHVTTTRLISDRVSDGRIRLWVDADEKPARPPLDAPGVLIGSLLAWIAAGCVAWSVSGLVRVSRHAWTARRAVAGWDREWRRHGTPGR